jgi:hypothetical protein
MNATNATGFPPDMAARMAAPMMNAAPPPAPPSVSRAPHRWETISWNIQHVSIAADQTAFTIEKDTNRIRARPAYLPDWSDLAMPPEQLVQLAAVNSSCVFAVSISGNIWMCSAGIWTRFPGSAKQISASMDGNLWCVTSKGVVMQWIRDAPARWVERGSHVRSVCVASKNIVWMIDALNQPHWWDGCSWEALPPVLFQHISVAESGCAAGLTPAGALYTWTGREWLHAASGFKDASMCNGKLLVVDVGNRCLCLHKMFKLEKAPTTSHPATVLLQPMAAFRAAPMEARPLLMNEFIAGSPPANTACMPSVQAVAAPSSPPLTRPSLTSSAEQSPPPGLFAEFEQLRTSVAAWSPDKYKAMVGMTSRSTPQATMTTAHVSTTTTDDFGVSSPGSYRDSSTDSSRIDPRMNITNTSDVSSLGSTVSASAAEVGLHTLLPDEPLERDISTEAVPYCAPITYSEDWAMIRGAPLQSISLGRVGQVVGLLSSHYIHTHHTDGSWTPNLEKQLSTMDCLDDKNIVGTDKANRLWHCRNGEWRMLPGRGIRMAIGEDGTIWSVNMTGTLQRWDAGMRRWRVELQGVVNVCAANIDIVWATGKHMQVFTRKDGKWTAVPGLLTKVACSTNGNVYGIDTAGQGVQWDGSIWKELGVSCTDICARENHLAILDR